MAEPFPQRVLTYGVEGRFKPFFGLSVSAAAICPDWHDRVQRDRQR
jgi:hypothetical protein